MHDKVLFPCDSQVAAKIEGGGSKRPLEEGPEPSAKKLASIESSYPPQPPQPQAMR